MQTSEWRQKELVYFKKGTEEWGEPLYVGTEELSDAGEGFEIFPNPAFDFSRISVSNIFAKAELKIYNSLGQLVYKDAIISENTIINVSGFESGIYIVLVETEEGILKEKLIIR